MSPFPSLFLPNHPSSSLLNRGLVEVGHEDEMVSLWEVILSLLTQPTSPSEVLEYVAVYTGVKNTAYVPLEQLGTHFNLVKKYALMLPELFPAGVVSCELSTVSLSIPQIKCLLSHMLLGSLPHCLEWREESRASAYYSQVLLYYLSLDLDTSDRRVSCHLHSTAPCQWDNLPDTFPPPERFAGRIEEHPVTNKVVFSNKNFGPGPGGSQEELMFGSYPEACVFPLIFSRPLGDLEVLVISQVLRVSDYAGYGREVEFKAYLDKFAKCHTLLLMDALEVDLFEDENQEFSPENISRELNKCFCGFSQFSGGEVVTGRWGCGAFGGTFRLKQRIQLFAALKAKVELVFCEPLIPKVKMF